MKKRLLYRKILSNRGASLMMALLLFLVCTVAGTVVLTAATAASGRASDFGEMEQRYFSVTSAARLLAKEYDGKTVTIIRSSEEVTRIEYQNDGTSSPPSDITQKYALYISSDNRIVFSSEVGSSESFKLPDSSLFTGRAVHLLFGDNHECESPKAFGSSFNKSPYTSSSDTGTITLYHTSDSLESSEKSALAINGKYRLDTDGYFYITVENSSDNISTYSIKITMMPIISEEEQETTVYSSDYNGNGLIEDEITTHSKTSNIKWKVSGIG